MIRSVSKENVDTLSQLSKSTFVQSHGHSANINDIGIYIRYAYSTGRLEKELNQKDNLFHFIHFEDNLAGYSKMSLNTDYPRIPEIPLAKLDRIYIDEEFLEHRLGQPLLDFNIELARQYGHQGIWLYTWTENHRAIKFYRKNGFVVIDEKAFKISSRHSNPNYIMYKKL